ncbi:MAG: hypothetical protein KGS10_04380 [Chloroflexi bacterium]|nr:hypothetical protein [Chloroflexota bacterium]
MDAATHIARLRAAGWSIRQIAVALSASSRQVFRWAAGTHEPLPVFARALAELAARPAAPPEDAAA